MFYTCCLIIYLAYLSRLLYLLHLISTVSYCDHNLKTLFTVMNMRRFDSRYRKIWHISVTWDHINQSIHCRSLCSKRKRRAPECFPSSFIHHQCQKLHSLKRIVKTTLATSHNKNNKNQKVFELWVMTCPIRRHCQVVWIDCACAVSRDVLLNFYHIFEIPGPICLFHFATFMALRSR